MSLLVNVSVRTSNFCKKQNRFRTSFRDMEKES